MKRSIAIAIVAGFKANGKVAAFSEEVLDYIQGKYGFIRPARVQAMVGQMCKRAADALWDGNETTAIAALMKYGLRDTRAANLVADESERGAAAARYRLVKAVKAARGMNYEAAASGGLASVARRGHSRKTYR